jgi:hypothetical protein
LLEVYRLKWFCARKLESMDKTSEQLMRSTLHDMANVLAGVKGILDLNRAGQPIGDRDRQRLEAVIEEGITTLDRCRHLSMATLPDGPLEPGSAWRAQLLEELEPMGTLFRSRFELAFDGAPEWDQWSGQLLRGYVRALTRQVMPHPLQRRPGRLDDVLEPGPGPARKPRQGPGGTSGGHLQPLGHAGRNGARRHALVRGRIHVRPDPQGRTGPVIKGIKPLEHLRSRARAG